MQGAEQFYNTQPPGLPTLGASKRCCRAGALTAKLLGQQLGPARVPGQPRLAPALQAGASHGISASHGASAGTSRGTPAHGGASTGTAIGRAKSGVSACGRRRRGQE